MILAVLKDAGLRPEVREELMRAVRNGRMSHGDGLEERRGDPVK